MRRIQLIAAILTLGVVLAALAWRGAAAETRALFPVRKQGKYGFIDRTGNMVIAPRFENAGAFFAGRARVQIAGKWATSIPAAKSPLNPALISPILFMTAWPW